MKIKPLAWAALPACALLGIVAFWAQDRLPRNTQAAITRLAAVAETTPQIGSTDSAQQKRRPTLPESERPDCTLTPQYLPNGDGTTTEVYTCERAQEVPRHPYEDYSDEALASLAWSDPKAAAILGMRLRTRDEALAMSLMIRSSALGGGDLRPLVQYFNAYPHPSSIDGVPVRQTVRTQFVLLSVMALLSPEPYDLSRWEDRIREFADDPEQEIAVLTRRSEAIVEEMRRIQLEVTGQTSLGG